jgi:hypothetical protein
VDEGGLGLKKTGLGIDRFEHAWRRVRGPDAGLSKPTLHLIKALKAFALQGDPADFDRCVDQVLINPGKLDTGIDEALILVEGGILTCKIGNYARAEKLLRDAATQTREDGIRHAIVKLIHGYVAYRLGRNAVMIEDWGEGWREMESWCQGSTGLDPSLRDYFKKLMEIIPPLETQLLLEGCTQSAPEDLTPEKASA